MEWNREAVGKVILDTRLALGLTLEAAGERIGVKSSVLSSLEKGRHLRPPNKGTQAKIEEAFGVVLPIPRGESIRTTIYLPARAEPYLLRAMTKFQAGSLSGNLFCVLKAWNEHQEQIDKWNEAHPEGKV